MGKIIDKLVVYCGAAVFVLFYVAAVLLFAIVRAIDRIWERHGEGLTDIKDTRPWHR